MLGWRKLKGLVGLDIGSSAIKAVELSRYRNGYELVNLALEELGPDGVADGIIKDPAAIALAIGKLFKENSIKTRNVAVAVAGHSVIVKKIAVTANNEAELVDAIPNEAQQQHIQLDMNDVRLSYQVLGRPSESVVGRPNPSNTFEVLLVAVKREKITNYAEVLQQAGVVPVVMDIDAFALENAFEVSYEPLPDLVVALLNIGASIMNINIIRGGEPLFTRDVSVGGNQYTDALEKEFGLSFQDAEMLKSGQQLGGVSPEARAIHLRSVSEIMLLEIQKTFDFFRHTTSVENIQQVYLAGGSARVEGLADLLKQDLSIPVEIMNPFRKIRIDSSKFDLSYVGELEPRMSVATGLALRAFDLA
jgi:type IV pilus assembly protein PilM